MGQLTNKMNKKQEKFDLKKATASAVQNADVKRHQIICEGLYNLIIEDPVGFFVPDFPCAVRSVKRERHSGWSYRDVQMMFLNPYNCSIDEENTRKVARFFKGIKPERDELVL